MKRLEWFVARRYLSSRRRGRRLLSLSTFIAIGGVAVGVMALMVVIAVMTGLQLDLQEKILSMTAHIQVTEAGSSFRMGNWREVKDRIERMPNVVAVAPWVNPNAIVTRTGTYAAPGQIYGIAPEMSRVAVSSVEDSLASAGISLGEPGAVYDCMANPPNIVLGHRLASRLTVLPGDTVVVGSFENMNIGALGNIQPAFCQFIVAGTVSTGMYEYDNLNMYARIEAVQSLLQLPADTISMLAVNIDDPWNSDEVARRIRDELGFPYETYDWKTLNSSLFSALALEKLVMAIILSLIILVAAFNIVSMLTMVVADKTREIGILKSMGMRDGTVLRIFMLQGLTIGAVGTLIGGIGGWLVILAVDRFGLVKIPADVYFIDTLPVALDPLDILLIAGVSMLIAFGATVYPALQAARLLPVEAIRGE
ncbi:MAG: FtsX-like permease family protein [Longimicrobiales bacterium]